MTPTLEVRVRELLSQIEADGLYKLPVAEFKAGFEIMRSGNCGKIVLDWKA